MQILSASFLTSYGRKTLLHRSTLFSSSACHPDLMDESFLKTENYFPRREQLSACS